MVLEIAIQMKNYLYLCFIDRAEIFDKRHHKELTELHSKINIFKKDIRIIKKL